MSLPAVDLKKPAPAAEKKEEEVEKGLSNDV